MLVPTTPTWGGYITKKYTYFTKKERPALEGDTFNGCPYPPLQQPCSFFLLYYVLKIIQQTDEPLRFLRTM